MQLLAAVRSVYSLDKYLDKLQSPIALLTRWYVAWVFLNSGYLKMQDWEQTVALFETEYRVPLLSPFWAALSGTAGELVFSILLILGLAGRIAPLGLFAVNALAVISYSHVLFADDGIVGLRQHECWGLLLAMLTVYGVGNWSLDALIKGRSSRG